MNKKITLSAAVLFAAVAGFSQPVMAEGSDVKIGGKLAAYFGQYDDGTDSGFKSVNEANLGVTVKQGNVTAFFEVENRNGATDNIVTQRSVMWAKDGVSVKVGTAIPKATVSFSAAGTGTSDLAKVGGYSGLTNKTEEDGLQLGYELGDAAKVGLTLYDVSYWNGKADGSTTIATLEGKAAGLEYRLALHSESEKKDVDGVGTGSDTASATHLALQYSMDALSVSVNSAMKSVVNVDDTASSEDTADTADTSLQVTYKVNKEQKAILTLGSVAETTTDIDGVVTSDKSKAITTLVYDVKLAEKSSLQLLYLSTTTTDNLASSDNTASFVGCGFLTKF